MRLHNIGLQRTSSRRLAAAEAGSLDARRSLTGFVAVGVLLCFLVSGCRSSGARLSFGATRHPIVDHGYNITIYDSPPWSEVERRCAVVTKEVGGRFFEILSAASTGPGDVFVISTDPNVTPEQIKPRMDVVFRVTDTEVPGHTFSVRTVLSQGGSRNHGI